MNIIYVINNLFDFYLILIILRIFLTWIPNLQWNEQPLKGLAAITDIYLQLFRKIVPPLNGFDFSPVLAIIVLQLIQHITINSIKHILGITNIL